MACQPVFFPGSVGAETPRSEQYLQTSVSPQAAASSANAIGTGVLRTCDECHKPGDKLNQCKKCDLVWYCSENCRERALDAHQTICKYSILIPKEGEYVCLLEEPNGNVKPITQAEFKRLTTSTYVSGPLFTPGALKKYPDEIACQEADAIALPKKVALKYYGEAIGYGIVALENIPPDRVVCDFGGLVLYQEEWVKTERSSRETSFAALSGEDFIFDPSRFASLGAFVNDGPPNAVLADYTVPEVYSGADSTDVVVPKTKKIVTLREVKKGEQLLWDYQARHPVKRGPYSLDKNTFDSFLKKHSTRLNLLILKTRGPSDSGPNKHKITPELAETMEIEYILGTPYVLASLHLDFNLDPAATLNEFEALSEELKEKYLSAKLILKGLSRIDPSHKQGFSKIVNSVSGIAFLNICEALAKSPEVPSAEDCAEFGQLYDRILLLHTGSFHANYWFRSERVKFKQQFVSHEHQQKIKQVDMEAGRLPPQLKEKCQNLKEVIVKAIPSDL